MKQRRACFFIGLVAVVAVYHVAVLVGLAPKVGSMPAQATTGMRRVPSARVMDPVSGGPQSLGVAAGIMTPQPTTPLPTRSGAPLRVGGRAAPPRRVVTPPVDVDTQIGGPLQRTAGYRHLGPQMKAPRLEVSGVNIVTGAESPSEISAARIGHFERRLGDPSLPTEKRRAYGAALAKERARSQEMGELLTQATREQLAATRARQAGRSFDPADMPASRRLQVLERDVLGEELGARRVGAVKQVRMAEMGPGEASQRLLVPLVGEREARAAERAVAAELSEPQPLPSREELRRQNVALLKRLEAAGIGETAPAPSPAPVKVPVQAKQKPLSTQDMNEALARRQVRRVTRDVPLFGERTGQGRIVPDDPAMALFDATIVTERRIDHYESKLADPNLSQAERDALSSKLATQKARLQKLSDAHLAYESDLALGGVDEAQRRMHDLSARIIMEEGPEEKLSVDAPGQRGPVEVMAVEEYLRSLRPVL